MQQCSIDENGNIYSVDMVCALSASFKTKTLATKMYVACVNCKLSKFKSMIIVYYRYDSSLVLVVTCGNLFSVSALSIVLCFLIKSLAVLACDKMAKGAVKAKSCMGVTVSTLHASDPPIPDERKSAFDWCKEGNVEVLQRLLLTNECNIQQIDENVSFFIDIIII